MNEYEKWENEVISIIQETLEVSRDEALAIIDSKPVTMITCWADELMANETFSALMDTQHEN